MLRFAAGLVVSLFAAACGFVVAWFLLLDPFDFLQLHVASVAGRSAGACCAWARLVWFGLLVSGAAVGFLQALGCSSLLGAGLAAQVCAASWSAWAGAVFSFVFCYGHWAMGC